MEKFDKKAYMKKYYEEHIKKYREASREWHKNNPEWRKKYYQENKEKFREQNKKWREEHRKRYSEMCQESRRRRVERLRAEGCTNAWNVVVRGVRAKYGSDKE